MTMRILFIGGTSAWCNYAEEAVHATGSKVQTIRWGFGDPRPTDLADWSGDYILSFKSPLILPKKLLSCARRNAINFHPSLPCYRGIGGYARALNERKSAYGVTCHHMSERIDAGPIIQVDTFPISASETLQSLIDKAACYCLIRLHAILAILKAGDELPVSDERWTGPLLKRESPDRVLAGGSLSKLSSPN